MITPDSSFLKGTVFTRLDHHCKSPIESTYYSSSKISKRKDLFAHCAKKDCTPNKELKKQFKTVVPICEQCKSKGKNEVTRGPLHTAAANKAKQAEKRKHVK